MASKKLLVVTILIFSVSMRSMRGSQAARPEPASPISSSTDHINKHMIINDLMHQVSLEEKGKEKKTMMLLLLQGKEGKILTETMGEEERENPCRDDEQHDEGKAAADEEQSLMRRTLVAHTDYIYTQGKHN